MKYELDKSYLYKLNKNMIKIHNGKMWFEYEIIAKLIFTTSQKLLNTKMAFWSGEYMFESSIYIKLPDMRTVRVSAHKTNPKDRKPKWFNELIINEQTEQKLLELETREDFHIFIFCLFEGLPL